MTDQATLQKALVTIQKLKHLLQEQKKKTFEPIAIIGLSCRFPQATNKEAYWELLSQGKNTISRIPDERWKLLENTDQIALRDESHPYWGGYLSDITSFDAYFFGITPREAARMDPQQRLLLEVAYEALEDAGFTAESLAGSKTGVFASLYGSQFAHLQKLESEMDALYLPTGNATSIAANRLSYLFDLRGPSIVLDTACSSSLVAIQLACLNIQNGLCDQAIVGGVNINLLPSINSVLAQAKMLSPDGQCKTFDAGANGYVPGEGVGVIILKKLSNALKDQDRIYAVITAATVNQDGKTNGLTAPNGLQQEELLKSAYQAAGIDPRCISYVECHGTGTFLGDPIEIQALGEVIGKYRDANQPCWIGSVKTNIGHLEPAAGMASIIKVALALKNKKIPPHLNFSTPNPHIAFNKYHLKIPTQMENWPKYGDYRAAGISGFGFGGTNAHLVVRELTEQEENMLSVRQEKKLHAWQHKTYWPLLGNTTAAQINSYPMQGSYIASPLSALQFQFKLDLKRIPEMKDTFNVAHIGYYLEMLAFAVNQIYQKSFFTAEDIHFLAPIIVNEHAVINVCLILEKIENDKLSFSFYSMRGEKQQWHEHVKGKLSIDLTEVSKIDAMDAIKKRCISEGNAEIFFKRVIEMGMPAGDSIRWAHRYWLNEKEILCEFQEPASCKNKDFKLNIHPGVFDGCVQTLFLLLPAHFIKPYVVSYIEKITYTSAKNTSLHLLATLKNIHKEGEKIAGDWQLANQDGKIISECRNVSMSQLDNKIQIDQIRKVSAQHNLNLSSLPLPERKQRATDFLAEQVAVIFGMPKEDVKADLSLTEMGMDSLMALVLMRVIETELGVTYSMQDILQGPSILDIVDYALPQQSISVQERKNNSWIAYRQNKTSAKMRLFCFPYGGGGASIYREWQRDLPDTFEICPVQFPGREDRMDEKPISNITTLMDALIENLQSEFDKPFAFFGHSFGSLVAFELARELRKRNLPQPQHLFASAFPDPKLPTKSLDNMLSQLNKLGLNLFELNDIDKLEQLSDEKINTLATVFNENGVAGYNDQAMNKEIMKILLPIFVGDMMLVKSYQYYDTPPLELPITVFIGKQDTWVYPADHAGWAAHTKDEYNSHEFDDGHLFIRDNQIRQKILKIIAEVAV